MRRGRIVGPKQYMKATLIPYCPYRDLNNTKPQEDARVISLVYIW